MCDDGFNVGFGQAFGPGQEDGLGGIGGRAVCREAFSHPGTGEQRRVVEGKAIDHSDGLGLAIPHEAAEPIERHRLGVRLEQQRSLNIRNILKKIRLSNVVFSRFTLVNRMLRTRSLSCVV